MSKYLDAVEHGKRDYKSYMGDVLAGRRQVEDCPQNPYQSPSNKYDTNVSEEWAGWNNGWNMAFTEGVSCV